MCQIKFGNRVLCAGQSIDKPKKTVKVYPSIYLLHTTCMRENLRPYPSPLDGSLRGKRLVTGVYYPNHHPLTKGEIVELLRALQNIASSGHNEDSGLSSEVALRLVQGIRGIVVPYPVFGPMRRRQTQLERMYIDWVDAGCDPAQIDGLADRLHELMQTSCGELLGLRIHALRERIKGLLSSRD